MTTEDELSRALRAQTDVVVVPPGDLAEVARRAKRRQRRQTGALGGGLAVVVVAAGVGFAALRPASETVVETAATAPDTLVQTGAASSPSSLVGQASSGDDKGDHYGEDEVVGPVTSRGTSELADLDLPARIAALVDATDACEMGQSIDVGSIVVADMADRTRIANVTCFMGAYQPTDVRLFVVEANDSLTPIGVEWPTTTGVTTEWVLAGFVDLVPDEGRLSAYVKHRGSGDCGIQMSHRWDGASSVFVLVQANGIIECPEGIPDDPPTTWPQIYPPVEEKGDEADGTSPFAGEPMDVPDACRADDLPRRAKHLLTNGAALECVKQALIGNGDGNQFWVEDTVDVGEATYVVWRSAAFDGDFGAGTPWGFEEIHVTEVNTWTNQLVQRLDWDDPADADWMYAYRIEFVDDRSLRMMIGWHQGECYWVDRIDFDGRLLPFDNHRYQRPASLEDLAADPSRCEFNIEFESQILDEVFDSDELLASFDRS